MTDPTPFDDTCPVFLGELWDRPLQRITPTLVGLHGDGHLLYAGMTHTIAAPSGSGKSWIAVAAMLTAVRETGRPTLFLDYEASVEVAITRLRQLGADRDDGGQVAYWRLDHAINGDHARQLGAWVDRYRPCLVVLDGVTRATALYGVDADTNNAGYTEWASTVQLACRANGAETDPALLLIDHVSEKTGGGLNARGVTAKRDTVTGAAFVLRGGPISPTRPVRLSLITAKSRHGGERDTPAAVVTVQPHDDGRLDIAFVAPDAGDRAAAHGQRAQLCEQLSRRLEDDGPASQRSLCDAVDGDDKQLRAAIQHLAGHGFIARDPDGKKTGGYHPYRSVKPYRARDRAA